ncbi:pyridoxal-phosphate dependent enzyme [Pelagovum pacificum]|uniref:Pyridoxal-phosphate dependent enzyme n=1 Tax=Pelagovum pacificum TaxID=2588711 RepID=A0A5C5G8G2_9RHOB|nr:pyridoxal-phosphate dependent enzyme [Pelagovum pacificum]QQA41561.1 pyridoxal-phosphate dependent enzyme [Pelagovum pacificum]TNY30841.1 pyridoxal-phosphate dependent enzyme [Pelagovum pacificum]
MPDVLKNPYRGAGLDLGMPRPVDDPSAVSRLLALCPRHGDTPLLDVPDLAAHCGVAAVRIKDERGRMGLGSFKALGAAFVIARDAAANDPDDWTSALSGWTYVAASAGNHGLSVAAGAALFGARALIYLADTVPEAFAHRLRAKGAEVVRSGATYEASMDAAEAAAAENGWTLLSDSTWEGSLDTGRGVMEGYLQMAVEAADAMDEAPTHILLQAGVGGLAGAVAAYARKRWSDGPEIIVVEPAAAPALIESVRAGRAVTAEGPVSAMGRLDCKTPSLVALAGLSADADRFVTISEGEAAEGVSVLYRLGLDTTPSGGAGLAALIAGLPDIGPDARILAILSEGPEG